MLALALAGCASHPADHSSDPDPVFGLGGRAPDSLQMLMADPYAAPPQTSQAIADQIGELDRLLGPDLDAGDQDADPWVTNLIRRTLLGLIPYRSAVRWIGGAGRSERLRARAVLAGFVRRGFLKGLALEDCASTDP